MSDIIRLLPDSVANQIAAGEVIQRPSSVIKELVENAIDAGATLVQVVIQDAGKASIQVIDNGVGMSETDARLSFERHATSKISQATDLFALRTMGFRGEALASIAAVAQVELRTRKKDQEVGTCLRIEGSRLVEQTPINCPAGANFIVRNLFFNIPVRRKFLKSNQTELANIMTEFERIALAHVDVAFKLYNQDTLLLDLPAANFLRRIQGVFGRKQADQLIPLSVETELAKISGYVGVPESAKKKGARQFFFTNGRYMRHAYFAKAVQTAFDWLVPEGESIPFFINFTMPPERIDVNIHPTKTEIKFQDEQLVFQILLAAVREALNRFSAIPSIDFDTENKPDIPVAPARPSYSPVPPRDFQRSATGSALLESYARARDIYNNVSPAPQTPATENLRTYEPTNLLPPDDIQTDFAAHDGGFQLAGKYVVVPSSGTDITIVDVHRAHLRVLFEQYLAATRSERGLSQGLLFPQEISLSAAEIAFLKTHDDHLRRLGFDVAAQEGGTYQLRGIPLGTEGLDPTTLLQNVIADSLDEAAPDPAQGAEHRLALSLARRAAMPVGVALSEEEMRHLLTSLHQTETPAYTPDGLPVYRQIALAEIETLFKA